MMLFFTALFVQFIIGGLWLARVNNREYIRRFDASQAAHGGIRWHELQAFALLRAVQDNRNVARMLDYMEALEYDNAIRPGSENKDEA